MSATVDTVDWSRYFKLPALLEAVFLWEKMQRKTIVFSFSFSSIIHMLLLVMEFHAVGHGGYESLHPGHEDVQVWEGQDHIALKFLNGSVVPTTTQVKYLGSRSSWISPFHRALYHRLGLPEEAFIKKLRMFWNSSLPRKTKVHIYHAAIVPFMADGQYYRSLRRSIGIKPRTIPGLLI